MADTIPLLLDCTRCKTFTRWAPENGERVSCGECGKNHSIASLWMADPEKDYERDEAGELQEIPP